MTKDKIKLQFESLFDKNLKEEDELINYSSREISVSESDVLDGKFSSKWLTFFRQAFLYFPGAILLWISSLGVTLSLISFLGVSPHSINYVIFVLSFFMTTLGLGDLRKTKDYIVPTSIIFIGIISGVIVSLLPNDIAIWFLTSGYILWFLPIPLIAPFVVKLWFEKDDYLDVV